MLAAAAALTACLAVGAGAAHSWSGDFAAFLGLGEGDSLGDMSLGLGLSQTLPGGTVTLEGVLGDDYCIYVPFTVEAPEGQVLDGTLDYGFDNCTYIPTPPTAWSSTWRCCRTTTPPTTSSAL